MDRVLVLGGGGMLGSAVARALIADRDVIARVPPRDEFDARADDPAALLPEGGGTVVNAIGLLKARIDEDDPDSVRAATEVNAAFPQRLADAADARGWRVIHVTTDAVFAGDDGGAPYDERAPHAPRHTYARTKSEGEVAAPHVVNLRCSIVGPERGAGRSLLSWVLGQPLGARIDGYDNQRWNGLTTLHLARLIRAAIDTGAELPGTLHLVPADAVTKAELVARLAAAFGRSDIDVVPVDAPRASDLRLTTIHPDVDAALWRAAGYDEAPTIVAMVDELALTVD